MNSVLNSNMSNVLAYVTIYMLTVQVQEMNLITFVFCNL